MQPHHNWRHGERASPAAVAVTLDPRDHGPLASNQPRKPIVDWGGVAVGWVRLLAARREETSCCTPVRFGGVTAVMPGGGDADGGDATRNDDAAHAGQQVGQGRSTRGWIEQVGDLRGVAKRRCRRAGRAAPREDPPRRGPPIGCDAKRVARAGRARPGRCRGRRRGRCGPWVPGAGGARRGGEGEGADADREGQRHGPQVAGGGGGLGVKVRTCPWRTVTTDASCRPLCRSADNLVSDDAYGCQLMSDSSAPFWPHDLGAQRPRLTAELPADVARKRRPRAM